MKCPDLVNKDMSYWDTIHLYWNHFTRRFLLFLKKNVKK